MNTVIHTRTPVLARDPVNSNITRSRVRTYVYLVDDTALFFDNDPVINSGLMFGAT